MSNNQLIPIEKKELITSIENSNYYSMNHINSPFEVSSSRNFEFEPKELEDINNSPTLKSKSRSNRYNSVVIPNSQSFNKFTHSKFNIDILKPNDPFSIHNNEKNNDKN